MGKISIARIYDTHDMVLCPHCKIWVVSLEIHACVYRAIYSEVILYIPEEKDIIQQW